MRINEDEPITLRVLSEYYNSVQLIPAWTGASLMNQFPVGAMADADHLVFEVPLDIGTYSFVVDQTSEALRETLSFCSAL